MLADDMDALVTRTENKIRRSWMAIILHLRAENPVAALEHRLYHHQPILGVDDAAAHLASSEHAAYVAAGQAEGTRLDGELAAPVRK